MDMFRVSPPINDVMSACNATQYSNDPDDCDVGASAVSSSAPSLALTAGPSAQSTGGGDSSGLELGDVAVVAFNSGVCVTALALVCTSRIIN
jgi:hypothetical protein